MGIYIYRVTAKLVKLADGRKAHVAKYAYKPFRDFDLNRRAHFETGCLASERLKLKSDLLVVLDEHEHSGVLYSNLLNLKVFYDDTTFGSANMPKVGDVKRIGQFGNVYALDVFALKERTAS